jgi:hypothetical protein
MSKQPHQQLTIFFLLAAAGTAGLPLLTSSVGAAVRLFPLFAFSFARSNPPPCPLSSPLLLSPVLLAPPPLAAAAGMASSASLLLSSDEP